MSETRALLLIQPAKFWAKMDRKGPDECWPWRGYVNPNGYPEYKIWDAERRKPISIRAYRMAYILVYGRYPGRVTRRTCDEALCCNPAHLARGDPATIWWGKAIDPLTKIGRVKLNPTLVRAIRQEIDAGTPYPAITARYGVSKGTISHIKTGRTWKHVA